MALLIAPYNNAMRIGQGFNSYTQQICVDDAVVVDPNRAENVITNDGTTMRIMAQKSAAPSAWTRQKEVIVENPATAVLVEHARKARDEVRVIEEELANGAEDESEARSERDSQPKEENSHGEKALGSNEITERIDEKASEVTGSVDEVTDADEAREKTDVSEKKESESAALNLETESSINDESSGQTAQAKGDEEGIEREAIVANLQANAEESAEVDQKAVSASLRANADKPVKRGISADRAHGRELKATNGHFNRAAVRNTMGQTGSAKDPATRDREAAEKVQREKEEQELLAEQRAYQRELLLQSRKEEETRRAEEREEQRAIRAEQRAWDAKRREEAYKAIEKAADLNSTSLKDLEKIRAQNQFVERYNGMAEQKHKYDFDPTAPRGPSQTVTYTSRFVDRLSDVMDDMSVSGSLSIKAGKIGASGKGSFVDSDKFKESDLNFYISVKVMNQTTNFKDALVYNPLRSVDEKNFREVYGDSFISGFVEGGEFNAIVSMKILNKAKKTDIQAEAKVALTAGTVQVEAQASVGVARSNIETNTETTIQVSWSGGGHIKPMEQQWDIQSLMAAAARFPDLVADCPQRIYAVLTKYDSLRSFVARKPATYTPLQYENAQIYTGTLLDAFVSYKALYKRLGEQIFQVQGKTLEIQQWSDSEEQTVSTTSVDTHNTGWKDDSTGLYPYREVNTRFEASLKGLSDARTTIRRQMARIVNEVDQIERDPKLATDEDHSEPYQSPVAFEARVPAVEVPARLQIKTHPLSGRRIMAQPPTEADEKRLAEEDARLAESSPLFTAADKLSEDEQVAMQSIVTDNPAIGECFRISCAAGDDSRGKFFNNLDYLKQNWNIRFIKTEMAEGALVYLAISYSNGLLVEKGAIRDGSRIKKFGPFFAAERVNSASIEHGRVVGGGSKDTQVLGLRLFTNRGRGLIARALRSETSEDKKSVTRDGVAYENVTSLYLDAPFNLGSVKGFFGRSDDTPNTGKIWRLGLVWCRTDEKTSDGADDQLENAGDMMDSEDLALLQKDQSLGSKTLKDAQNALALAAEERKTLQSQLSEVNKSLENSRDDVRNKSGEIERMKAEANKKPIQNIEPQCGTYKGTDKGWRSGGDSTAMTRQTFQTPYKNPPKIIYGLSKIDVEHQRSSAMALDLADVSSSEFTVQMSSYNDSRAYDMELAWMTLPDDLHLENGSISTYGTGQRDWDIFSRRVSFNQNFASQPTVCVWLQGFEFAAGHDFTSLLCSTDNVTAGGFTLNIKSRNNSRFRGARAGWLAIPSEENGKRVMCGTELVEGASRAARTVSLDGKSFSRTPATFVAISDIDFGREAFLRAVCLGHALNKKEMSLDYGTWEDSKLNHMKITWIALV